MAMISHLEQGLWLELIATSRNAFALSVTRMSRAWMRFERGAESSGLTYMR
jgi:hypothetical protein